MEKQLARPNILDILLGIKSWTGKFFIWPPKWRLNLEVSKRVTALIPDWPFIRLSQKQDFPIPIEETTPKPVTTTLNFLGIWSVRFI
jgi:hypothetical protein